MVKRLSNAPWQYKRYLYPKMLPHQKVFVIPPICERKASVPLPLCRSLSLSLSLSL